MADENEYRANIPYNKAEQFHQALHTVAIVAKVSQYQSREVALKLPSFSKNSQNKSKTPQYTSKIKCKIEYC